MRTLYNSFIFFFLIFVTQSVSAAELFQFNRNVVGFVNHHAPQSVLFMSADGKSDWFTGTQLSKSVSYKITNPNCIPHSQSTVTMDDNQAGMTLAYPFLVGVGWVCKIDDQTNSIDLLSQFSLPENAYSIVYAGEDVNSSYFLMNSKPWKGEGYLHVVSIHKLTSKITTKIFASNVPGYSGAMLFDNDDVWVTAWPGKVYKIAHEKLMNLVQTGTQATFLEIAQLELNTFDGMSFFMLANEKSLLYYNMYDGEDYDNYIINRLTKTKLTVSVPCTPVSGYKQEWLLLCDDTSLHKENLL